MTPPYDIPEDPASFGGTNPAEGPYRHAGGRTCAITLAALVSAPALAVALLVKAVRS